LVPVSLIIAFSPHLPWRWPLAISINYSLSVCTIAGKTNLLKNFKTARWKSI